MCGLDVSALNDARQRTPAPVSKLVIRNKHDFETERYVFGQLFMKSFRRHPLALALLAVEHGSFDNRSKGYVLLCHLR